MRPSPAAIAILALLLLPGGSGSAFAADTVSVEIGSVYASNEGASMDPVLGNIRGKLQSMFNYTSYKLLDRKRRSLAVGETGEFELPGRRTMRVTPQPAQGNKVRLSVQITEGAKNLLNTTLGLSRGGMVLVGGPTHQSGVLILIISAE
ncbi:MAG TPA: hypothetical protein VF847_04440 [Candidatus Deferrimicrobiaceae bacterium]